MMRNRRGRLTATTLVGGLVAVAVAATAPAAALAVSGSVYPAGHNVSFGSQSVAVYTPLGANTTCTLDGGDVAIPAAPANQNATGPVTLNYTTRPSFSSCTSIAGLPITVTTSGSWQLKLQWGAPAQATVVVPASGLTVTVQHFCQGKNAAASSFAGFWQNGFASPWTESVLSLVGGASAPQLKYGCSISTMPSLVSSPVLTASDTTDPTSLVTVGS